MSFFKGRNCYLRNYNLSLSDKIFGFNYLYLLFICIVVGFGITVLYSVGNGHFYPWAFKQTSRFLLSLIVLFRPM